jgi:hypothetical protein
MLTTEELAQVSKEAQSFNLKKSSKACYDSKIKFIVNFLAQYEEYSDQLEPHPDDPSKLQLKLPLTFQAIQSVFAHIIQDVTLPTQRGGKRKQADEVQVIDTTLSKMNSVTIAKTTLSGYKSALKQHYLTRGISFSCPERGSTEISIDDFLNAAVKNYGNALADKKVRK